MFASDIMTENVISVRPRSTVFEIAELMVVKMISGVPVVSEDGDVVGVVTEADLLHRPELERHESRQSHWWLRALFGPERSAHQFIKAFGVHAEEVMSSPAITVDALTPAGEIAQILEERGIKWVPVTRHQHLIGIVSRRDLIKRIVANHNIPVAAGLDDDSIRNQLTELLANEEWVTSPCAWFSVENGTIYLRGMAETEEQVRALVVAAENVRGARSISNHIQVLEPINYALLS